MGCELSKLASSQKSDSGGNALGPQEPPPPAPPDPRLPLTAKQKYTMMASWKGISRATQATGICMFIKLFEEHSDLLYMFSKFKELKTKEEQATSEELAEHANKVMETLDEGIRGLDDLDTFFEFLHQIGASHRRIPGFKKEYFWKIEKPFLEAVEQTLGDRYTQNVEGIYKVTIKFIIETLVNGFEKTNNNSSANNKTATTTTTPPPLSSAKVETTPNKSNDQLIDTQKTTEQQKNNMKPPPSTGTVNS